VKRLKFGLFSLFFEDERLSCTSMRIRELDHSRLKRFAKRHDVPMVEVLTKLLDQIDGASSDVLVCKRCGAKLELVTEAS
jgi:hypothetical protein